MEIAGVLLIIQGAAGLVYHFFGWFKLWTIVHYVSLLAGYEIFANVMLATLGLVVLIASDKFAGR